VEQRWSLKKNLQGDRKECEDEEDRDDEEVSEDDLRESQKEVEEGTLLLTSY